MLENDLNTFEAHQRKSKVSERRTVCGKAYLPEPMDQKLFRSNGMRYWGNGES